MRRSIKLRGIIPISEAFLDKLLTGAPPETSLGTLVGEWHTRLRNNPKGPPLSDVEQNADLCHSLHWWVSIGGHDYYFHHVDRAHVLATARALRILPLPAAATILERALALCVPYPLRAPVCLDRRARHVSDDPRYAALDQAMWGQPIAHSVLQYVQRNRDQVLRPERGLPH